MKTILNLLCLTFLFSTTNLVAQSLVGRQSISDRIH